MIVARMIDRQSENPYKPSDDVSPREKIAWNPLATAILPSIVAATATAFIYCILVMVAKIIGHLIPGDGPLSRRGLLAIFADNLLVFAVVTMLAGFSALGYYGGLKKINAGICVLTIFFAGVISSNSLSPFGYGSIRHLRMVHPPIYLSEFFTYLIPYGATAFILAFLGNRSTARS